MGLFDSSTSTSSKSGINVAPETDLEKQANPLLGRQLTGMEGLVNAGPGAEAMTGATGAANDYSSLLQRLGTGTGLLDAQQAGIGGYTQLGNQLYGGLMRQQTAQAQQMAARQGRGMNDLMLQNKLGQQRNDLVGSFAAQQAMAAPGQQAQYMGERNNVMQGLASQAMANRQSLLSAGSTLREQDRAYRINTGERYSNTSQTSNPSMMSNLGAIAGIAGAAFGAGGLFSAGGALGGAAKGAAGGVGSQLGSGMTGTLGVGGGGQGQSFLGAFGQTAGQLGQAAGGIRQMIPGQQAGFGGGPIQGGGAMGLGGYNSNNPIMGGQVDYGMPVGQGYSGLNWPQAGK